MYIIYIYICLYIYIYVKPRVRETSYALRHDCILYYFFLVSGYSLDIKEMIYAIIRNVILYFDWF